MTSQKWTPESEPLFAAMTIGERVKWLLEYRGMKQTEAAAKIGKTQAMFSNIVTDSSRKPSAPSLLDMADIFECRPRWILDGMGDPFAWAVVTDSRQAELLRVFRALPEQQKQALIQMARALTK